MLGYDTAAAVAVVVVLPLLKPAVYDGELTIVVMTSCVESGPLAVIPVVDVDDMSVSLLHFTGAVRDPPVLVPLLLGFVIDVLFSSCCVLNSLVIEYECEVVDECAE